MSLLKLTEQKKLPDFQYMDTETLEWIRKNRPQFSPKDQLIFDKSLVKNLLERFIPSKEWYFDQKEIDTIHGIRHTMRVTTYAVIYLLAGRKDFIDGNYCAIVAASMHDLRRKNDKGDEGHAKRAADWFEKNSKLVSERYTLPLSDQDIEEIYYTVCFHETPYDKIAQDINYNKYKKSVDLLKACDALDRYRLPKLSWWINDNYLRKIPDESKKAFAFNFVVSSEKAYLETADNGKSVIKTI